MKICRLKLIKLTIADNKILYAPWKQIKNVSDLTLGKLSSVILYFTTAPYIHNMLFHIMPTWLDTLYIIYKCVSKCMYLYLYTFIYFRLTIAGSKHAKLISEFIHFTCLNLTQIFDNSWRHLKIRDCTNFIERDWKCSKPVCICF